MTTNDDRDDGGACWANEYAAHALDVCLPSQGDLIAAGRDGVPSDDDGHGSE